LASLEQPAASVAASIRMTILNAIPDVLMFCDLFF